jgi:hypothetical protein
MKKPTAIWTYADFSMWGSMSAMRANRWRRRQRPADLGLTVSRDPWWKRLWRALASAFSPRRFWSWRGKA